MIRPIRLSIVLTHPVQYYSPWFRAIERDFPEISLTVIYATEPNSAQQAEGFGQPFNWDIPLRAGYTSLVARNARPGDSLNAKSFWGLDVPEVSDALTASRPDVALIPGWHSATLLRALRHCRRRGIPVLYRGDSNLQSGPRGMKRALWRVRTRKMLGYYDAYLAVGRLSLEYLESFGIDASRVFRSPHCVDNAFFQTAAAAERASESRLRARSELGIADHAFVALFVGKLDNNKRVADLIDAQRFTRTPIHVLAAGSGDLGEALLIKARDANAPVTWLGFVNQTQLPRAYALADCLVLPSQTETWGLVVNEALACGVPCVVSDGVGCAPDLIVPGVTGYIFNGGDPASLGRALDQVRTAIENGMMTSSACIDHVAGFSFKAATQGVLEASHFVMHGRGC